MDRISELLAEYGVKIDAAPVKASHALPPSGERRKCPECGGSYAGRNSAMNHLRRVHNYPNVKASQAVTPGGPGVTCEVCGFLASAGTGIAPYRRSHG